MILVTGAAGFIGSYLAREILAEAGPDSLLLCDTQEAWDADRRCARVLRQAGIRFRPFESLEADSDRDFEGITGIFHMGASSRTDEMREDYLARMNVGFTQLLWRRATRLAVPFVYASSASTYGAGEEGYSDDPARVPRLSPLNPYGWSKQRFDLWALAEVAAGRHPPRWAGLKFFNVYGPGEDHKGSQGSVVHHARRQLETLGLVKLFRSERPEYADGEQKRDFVYVGDCVRVARAVADGRVNSGLYNVGTGRARTWIDLVEAVGLAIGREARIEFIDIPASLRAHYQYFTEADLARLRGAGYGAPFTDLVEGVRRTFEEEARL